MYTLTNGKIKVECIKKNKYGLKVGKIYDAYYIKSPFKGKEKLLSVIDDYGEEYAYPSEYFKIAKDL